MLSLLWDLQIKPFFDKAKGRERDVYERYAVKFFVFMWRRSMDLSVSPLSFCTRVGEIVVISGFARKRWPKRVRNQSKTRFSRYLSKGTAINGLWPLFLCGGSCPRQNLQTICWPGENFYRRA